MDSKWTQNEPMDPVMDQYGPKIVMLKNTYKTCKKTSSDPTRKVGNAGKVTIIFHIQGRMDLNEGSSSILLQLCVKHQVEARVRRIAHQCRQL